MLTDSELASLREQHSPDARRPGYCRTCLVRVPCDVAALVADLQELKAAIRAIEIQRAAETWIGQEEDSSPSAARPAPALPS